MGAISFRRVLRPLLWLLWLVLLSTVLPVLLVFITPFLALVWLVGLVPACTSESFRREMGVTRTGYLLWALLWPVLLVTMMVPAMALAAGLALHLYGEIPAEWLQLPAVLHGNLSSDLRRLLPVPNLSLHDWAWICIVAGALGVASHLVYCLMDIPWRLKQIRQVAALPRSKARSAALGLVELEGVARLLPARGEPPKAGEMQPFLLEDETGHILVDPRGVVLRQRTQSGVSLQLNEVEEGIREGDRVYVMGNVQRRNPGAGEDPGSDRLVVRPLRQSLVSSPIGRVLFPQRRQMADRDAANIFIVDKGSEQDVAMRLRTALWDFSVMSAIYLAASLWLVCAAWQWLA
jgi:hypothetical protein